MDNITKCTDTLRVLLAKGETNGIPLAERALNDLVMVTPPVKRRAVLDSVRAIVRAHRNAADGQQRDFAETINGYFGKLLNDTQTP
jgi:hypothetical protein